MKKTRFLGAIVASFVLVLSAGLAAHAAPPGSSDTKQACADVTDYGQTAPSYNGSTGTLSVSIALAATACPTKVSYHLFVAPDSALGATVDASPSAVSGNQVTFTVTGFNIAQPTANLSSCAAGASDTSGCAFFWVETIDKKGTVLDRAPDINSSADVPAECLADPATYLTTASDGTPTQKDRCDVGQLPMH